VRTGENSRAAILLFPETLIRLDQQSSIVFKQAETDTIPFWLELLKGAAHFISRDPRPLEIITPFANAAIEGTEFLVTVTANQAGIIVYEGRVRASNNSGSVSVGRGEAAIALAGAAPRAETVLRPRDAVHWTLYYPPVLFAGDATVQQAARALTVGRVDTAEATLARVLAQDANNSDALALQAIIALTQNDKTTALALAGKAVDVRAESAAAHIALSYSQQAHFDLSGALASLQTAVAVAPHNALAWARLAELWLSVGDIDQGLNAAKHAATLDPGIALSRTIQGFANLSKTRIAKAMAAFEQAIELDQAAPLPRLGLGLARIRKGDLADGRGEIEIAVALDPGNSLMRSYMGKAYFDEKRGRLAATQYEMAKELDPNDPTPFFYDAIRKQTENRPVEALHDMQTSIALNDNRAVFRSRLQLDEDLASRSASIARIYRDLGFEQRALVEGWTSVNTDPANFSAHRLLADSYSSLPRHQVARVSELLQSQLLQPLNLTPVQPQLAESNLFILEGAGPSDPAFLEFTPLFLRNRLALQANGVIGGNDTWGNDLIHNGVYNNLSWSLGQFHYESDGFRDNNDQDRDIYNLFVQGALSHRTSVQAELRHKDEDFGELPLRFDPDDFLPVNRNSDDTDTARVGLHHRFTEKSDLIASVIYEDQDEGDKLETPVGPLLVRTDADTSSDGYTAELQHIYRGSKWKLVSGAGRFDADTEVDSTNMTFAPPLFPPFPDTLNNVKSDTEHNNAYLYSYVEPLPGVTLTLGASFDAFDEDATTTNTIVGVPVPPMTSKTSTDRDKFNPKFGLTWEATTATTLRLAAFRAMKRHVVSSQTVEPTQVAGFNQFYDDEVNGTVATRYGIAVDQVFSRDISSGLEYSWRKLDVPLEFLAPAGFTDDDWDERFGRAYLYWTPHDRIAASAEYQYELFERDDFAGELHATRLRTHRVPLTVKLFHPSGFSARVRVTYVDQEGDIASAPPQPFPVTTDESDRFWMTDAAISYRLPRRRGIVSVGVANLFDEDIQFQDTDLEHPTVYPERFVFARVTLSF
jgi:tetratricopeptide (TPR) repeat protein